MSDDKLYSAAPKGAADLFAIISYITFMFVRILLLIAFVVGVQFAYAETVATSTTATTTLATSTESLTTTSTPPLSTFENIDEQDLPPIPEDPLTRAARLSQEQAEREKNQLPLAEAKQERISKLASNMSYRMDAVVERFTNIIGRLEVRTERIKQNNLDTTAAEEEIKKANASLAKAKNLLTTIDKLVYGAVTSPRPLTDWLIVKETYFQIGGALRQSQEHLQNAVILLKEARILITEPAVGTTTQIVE